MKNILLLSIGLLISSIGCKDEPESTMTIHEYCRARVDEMWNNSTYAETFSGSVKSKKYMEDLINNEFFMMCIRNKGL